MIGRIIGTGITGFIGIVLIVLGWLIWKKEKINLLHDYHIDKVSSENKTAFCKLSGIGIFVIGISLLITAAILGMTDSVLSFLSFAIGFIAGISMLIIAGIKYNH